MAVPLDATFVILNCAIGSKSGSVAERIMVLAVFRPAFTDCAVATGGLSVLAIFIVVVAVSKRTPSEAIKET